LTPDVLNTILFIRTFNHLAYSLILPQTYRRLNFSANDKNQNGGILPPFRFLVVVPILPYLVLLQHKKTVIMEKQAAAKVLYMDNISSKEIAAVLGISENTISKWAISDNWKAKRISKEFSDQNREEVVLHIVDYQLSVIKRMTEELSEISDDDGNTMPPRLLPPKIADEVTKFHNMVKRKEMEWADIVKILRQYTYFLAQNNPELAKKSTEYVQEFLNHKREQTI
jgi:DNA-binding MarR family transcriptional regulator